MLSIFFLLVFIFISFYFPCLPSFRPFLISFFPSFLRFLFPFLSFIAPMSLLFNFSSSFFHSLYLPSLLSYSSPRIPLPSSLLPAMSRQQGGITVTYPCFLINPHIDSLHIPPAIRNYRPHFQHSFPISLAGFTHCSERRLNLTHRCSHFK